VSEAAGLDWDRTVFALISPDAVARHLAGAVLDRLAGFGYRPLAWRMLWHRPADLDSFHERNISHSWDAYQYRLVDQLFAFGPAVALLLADDRPSGAQASHQRLRAAKGSSRPADARPGTIRGDLGSINLMLALMHSADSAADSRHESAVFAGPGGFEFPADSGELRAGLRLLDQARPPELRGHPEVLAGVRARLLAAAWDDLPRVERKAAAAMLAADAGCRGLAGPGELPAGPGEPLAGPSELLAGPGELLAGLLPAAHPLAEVLRADFTPQSPGPGLERVRLLLRNYGTDLDAWEDLVLATSRRFQPRGVS
jgi:nucleoside diphosphate kinase